MAKKAYARPQHKVKPLTVIIIVGVIFVFATLIAVLIPSDKEKIFTAYSNAGSPNLQEDHVFESISASNLAKVIESDEPVMVYFGTPTCPVCVNEIGFYDIEFKAAGLKESIGVIYYVNTTTVTAAQLTSLQSKFQFAFQGTPELYYLNNGAIVEKRADFTESTAAAQIRAFMTEVATHLG